MPEAMSPGEFEEYQTQKTRKKMTGKSSPKQYESKRGALGHAWEGIRRGVFHAAPEHETEEEQEVEGSGDRPKGNPGYDNPGSPVDESRGESVAGMAAGEGGGGSDAVYATVEDPTSPGVTHVFKAGSRDELNDLVRSYAEKD